MNPLQSQLTEKIDVIRKKLTDPTVKLTKEDVILCSNELQEMYKKLLMSDLEGGISRQVENFMWNDCFKIPLAFFIKLDRALFNWMIESGVGFYLGFIQEVGIQFDVPFIKNSSRGLYCTTPKMKPVWKMTPSKSAVYYIIQNSMVHVGDLLRYRGSFLEALKMYEKSTSVSPSNGHPYNQMGLVQLSIDHKSIDSLLSGIYYYVRAVSVANPFLPTLTNLEVLLGKVKNVMPQGREEEFIHTFLLGIGNLEMITLNSTSFSGLLGLVLGRKKLNYHQLFRIIVIALWAWKRETDKGLLGLESSTRINNALDIVASVINGLMVGISEETDATESIYIPHFKLCFEWLRLNPYVLTNETFASKFDTTGLCLLINRLLPLDQKLIELSKSLGHVILPEEKKLLGFLPLTKAYEHLQTVVDETDPGTKAVRVTRLLTCLEFLAQPQFKFLEYSPLTKDFRPVHTKQHSKTCGIGAGPIRPPLPPSSRRNVALQSILNQMDSRGQGAGAQVQQQSSYLTPISLSGCAAQISNSSSTISSAPPGLTAASNFSSIFTTPSPTPTNLWGDSKSTPGGSVSGSPDSDDPTTTPNFTNLFTSIWTPLGGSSVSTSVIEPPTSIGDVIGTNEYRSTSSAGHSPIGGMGLGGLGLGQGHGVGVGIENIWK